MNRGHVNLYSGGEVSRDEIIHFEDLARKFSEKTALPMFGGDHADGNLALLPDIINVAFEIGIASSPDSSSCGYEYGIWGCSADSTSLVYSLVLLATLAETCGGIAMCCHSQGVASNIIAQAKKELSFVPRRAGVCVQEGSSPPWCGTLSAPHRDLPARVATQAVHTGDGYLLNGTKAFTYCMNEVDGFVVFAREGEQWASFVVPADAPGLTLEDVGHRTGLRACRLNHVVLHNVALSEAHRIDDGDALDLVIRALFLNWAGMSAIATGIAKSAVKAARVYMSERYQGGSLLEDHPAMKLLVADAAARTRAAEAAVFSLKGLNPLLKECLKAAAMTKLTVMELCARAVTDSLQVMGGYGYMEDYGQEKRLRDITVLKSASGSPNYLKQLIFDLDKEGI